LERFDRRGGSRVPYVSAMPLLGARDGDSHDYIEIAEAFPEVSASTTADLNELWRHVVFSVLTNNTDGDLRNHGLLHETGGWRLSPVFDVNPNPDSGTSRQTEMGGAYHRTKALTALRSYAKEFDLTSASADQILSEVVETVSGWRDAASSNGAGSMELDLFTEAFWLPS
jgi:serine/threonine-protein kinase HipA